MRSPSDQPPAVTNRTSPSVDSDYDSIHAAVMETVRGRWFLSEYARRNRHADTDVLLKAIGRIESFLEDQVQDQGPDLIPSENNDNRPVLSEDVPAAAAEPFFAPKEQLEAANAELVLVREHIRNIADSLIECGSPSFLTNDLKRRLEDISRVCMRLGDIAKVAQPVVDDVVATEEGSSSSDAHVRAMSDHDPSVQAPSAEEVAVTEISIQDIEATVTQDGACDVNDMSDVVIVSEPEPQTRRDPFADIRALSPIEKIALFT